MTTCPPIRVLIAEDHAVVRQGFAAIVDHEPDMEVVAEAKDGQQAVDYYRQHQPDVVLMDLQMPKLEGTEAIIQIRAEFPNARIIILTTYKGDEDIYRGLQAGARGYLLKDTTAEELLDAIHNVYQGRKHVPAELALKLADRVHSTALTEREIEVLQLLVRGRSNQAIATELSISDGTAKFHVNNILRKLGVEDRASGRRRH